MVDNILFEDFLSAKTYNYTFNDIRANHTIEASFIQKFTITASSGIGGSIEPEGEITVLQGENQNFTITPDIGFIISDVLFR